MSAAGKRNCRGALRPRSRRASSLPVNSSPKNAKSATPNGVALPSLCAGHWPPKIVWAMEYPHCSYSRLPGRYLPFSGPLRWRLLLPGVFFILGWSSNSQRLIITGAYLIAIVMPNSALFTFNNLHRQTHKDSLDSGSYFRKILQKTIESLFHR
jgi:hypothetical protein